MEPPVWTINKRYRLPTLNDMTSRFIKSRLHSNLSVEQPASILRDMAFAFLAIFGGSLSRLLRKLREKLTSRIDSDFPIEYLIGLI